jgi:4-amino-4-deoxy-L-arabinose transferase-like glycosyltransferase
MRNSTFMAIGIGILLRIVVSFGVLASLGQADDGPSFVRQATEMLQGTIGYYYFPPGTAFMTVPIYAVLGPGAASDHLVGTLCSIALLLSTVFLAQTLTGWGRTTLITAWIAALYPHTVLASTQLSSHILAATLVTTAATLAIRNGSAWSWARWAGVGLCMAGALITRPATATFFLVLAIGGIVILRRRTIAPATAVGAAALVVLAAAAALLPVTSHNAAHGHGYAISTNNEWNVFLGNTPYTPDYKTGHFGQRDFAQLDSASREYLRRYLPHESPYAATREERMAMAAAASDYIVAHPWRTLYRAANRIRGYWGMDYTMSRMLQNAFGLSTSAFLPLLALEGGAYCLIVLLALSAPFLVDRPLGGQGRFLLAGVVLGMVPYVLAFALAKYHVSAIPVIMVAAGAAVHALRERPADAWATLRSRPLWWVLVAGFVALQTEHLYHLVRLR